ncbi:MAG: hypothetical protein H0T92_25350, partial [Pyrinomonadaceae bacterium]|nr:hypothetical protein [Pyrinomonadaceae bacterium]
SNRPDLIGNPVFGEFRDAQGNIRFINDSGIGRPGSAFAVTGLGAYGNIPRNRFRGPNYWNTDASLFKKFLFTEDTSLEFRVEVQNLFNHVNLTTPDGGLGSPSNPNANFGRISGIEGEQLERNPQRNFQFALRLQF